MEARELFTEIEAFVTRTRDEAMTKPGINGEGHTHLLGHYSKYRDHSDRGVCTIYFGQVNYFSIEISNDEVYFRATIDKGYVSVENRSAIAFESHKDEIFSIWERAISRTTLSLYEQELERLISDRYTKHHELKMLDRKIGEHKRKIKNTNTSSL